ncbi:hypothetical protein IW262DRAFT_1412189 [Armillaria fumosa]|nr:hypothetical protein IW262DRAFT_1412189 [Armillaria fumosa]
MMVSTMISEMLQLTRPTRIHQNGGKTNLGQILYRVHAFINIFLLYDKFRPFIYANQDAISTIPAAMMHRTSRVKAVDFLESLVKYDTGLILKKTDLFLPLFIEITKLGRKLIKSDKGTVFAIFQKDGARSLNDEGALPLAKVRDTLRLLVPLHEDFVKSILEPQNFGIISKTINFQDIVHARRGDHIEAEIARVNCLQKLIDYPDARKLMNGDLMHPLLRVYQAFDEELDPVIG